MRKWLLNLRKRSLPAIKNGFGAARRRDAIDGAKRWCSILGSLCQQTNYSQRRTLQGACEVPVAFALAQGVAMTDFDEEMRKQGVGWTTELEYWATTAEFAPLVVTKLRETLERHGLELRKDKPNARKSRRHP